jgi:hypothetical protein
MDFLGGFPTMRKGHDYLFVVVDKFNKMCILMPCKIIIRGQEATRIFFEYVWVHFGIPKSIISGRDTRFVSAFWTTLGVNTKLNIYTTFHPKIYG